MKLPAAAIAVPFASGIALGLHPSVEPRAGARFPLALFLCRIPGRGRAHFAERVVTGPYTF